MAWKFIDSNNPAGAAEVARIEKQTAEWWQAFQQNTANLQRFLTDKDFEWDIESFVEENLQSISPNIMWEIDGIDEKNFFFCITAEDERHLHPLVEYIISKAPEIEYWKFLPQRLPKDNGEAESMLVETTGVVFQQMMFALNPSDGNIFQLDVAFHGKEKINQKTADHAAFMVAELLLGEVDFNKWIGEIVATRKQIAPEKLVAAGYAELQYLTGTVGAEADKVLESLPAEPIFKLKPKLKRQDFSLEPEKSSDYSERLDMMAATSCIPETWKAAHGELLFDSSRYSKFGERFCYLKMDGDGSYANSAQSRDRLAQTLDERLTAAEVGCTTGGAGGLRYSYIDLALTDVDRAIPILKETLSYEHMPERSWLLFFDTDWEREWVGMSVNTPAPPSMLHPYTVDED